jgi:hypothetical protein
MGHEKSGVNMPRNLRKFDRNSTSPEVQQFFKDADAYFKQNLTVNEYTDQQNKYKLVNPLLFERAKLHFQ